MMGYRELLRWLQEIYPEGEARSIARLVMEQTFGMSLTDLVMGLGDSLTSMEQERLAYIAQRLRKGEPVQYVLGEALFCGYSFKVTPATLIPRPETEQLVDLINERNIKHNSEILDLCTGSGCIAISLKKLCPDIRVTATDISEDALSVARENASKLSADVNFIHADVLNMPHCVNIYDIIVSNPPYICQKEASEMEPHVLLHEPHLALFVPDCDPLRFYRPIAQYAANALKPNGRLFLEINPLYNDMLCNMLQHAGFNIITTHLDSNEKQRFVEASRK